MYILLSNKNVVLEVIPDDNPIFPGVPIEDRYAPDFVARLRHFDDGTPVAHGWVYDPESGVFDPPTPSMPANEAQLRADVDYLAALGGVEL